MPTPGERRALIFIASVAALGVAVRGWREFHPQDSTVLAGNRTALARQIEAVDSAITVTSSKRKPRAPRAPGAPRAPRADAPGTEPAPRVSRSRARPAAPADPHPRDPRQGYWDRSTYFDSVQRTLDPRANAEAVAHSRAAERSPPPAARHLPSQQKWAAPPVDLDIASIEETSAIPFIGPALARRIVTDRIENGPFGSIAELQRIPGITTAFVHRLEPFVTFSRAPRLGSAGERRPRSKSERRPGGDSRP